MSSLTSLYVERTGFLIGSVYAFAGSSAPTGYLLCDGSAVSRTTYANLFAAIGTTYGVGDGSTTFNVPNTSGLFIQSSGTQTVSAKSITGGTVGSKVEYKTAINTLTNSTTNTPTVTLSSPGTNLAHTHSFSDFYGQISPPIYDIGGNANANALSPAPSILNQSDTTGSALGNHAHTNTYSATHSTTPSSTDTETAPAAISLNYIIRY